MAKKTAKTTVHALLVAVDDYREDITVNGAYFPKLGGCVNDANDVLEYLKSDDTIQLNATFLKDQQATKPNVVAAFAELAKKAKSKDVVLFYYSGHGTCEAADTEVWTDQSNGRLEAIVCHYDNDYSPSFLLVDKELRYLINYLSKRTKAHVVAISDCCHSGDNTRAVLEPNIVQRRVDFVFQQRKWEDFVFANQFKREDFLGKSVNDVLSQGAHVQMAAAESDEPAVEVNGHGVFTLHLLEALRQTDGNISYQDLNNRIRNRMRVVFEQKPKLYAPDQFRALLRKGFFKKPVGKIAGGTLVFNPSQKAWVLDKGVLHGIEAGKTELEIRLPDGNIASAKVGNAELDHAQLQLDSDTSKLLDKKSSYPAKLSGIRREVVKVRMVNKDALPGQEAEILSKRLGEKDFISFTDDPAQADFDLVMRDDLYYLTKPGDPFRPLVEPSHSGVAKAAGELEDHLRHVANWMYFNRLANNSSKNALPESLLSVQFFKVDTNGAETPIKVSNGNVPLKLEEAEGGWGGAVKIVLTNKHTKNLYVAGIYQSEDFSCQPGLFEPHVKMIEPGNSEVVFEHGGGVIPLQLDRKWFWYNWERGTETVKFLFSTSNFDASNLEMAGLPMPLHPDSEQVGSDRGIFNLKKPALAGWGSVNFKLNIPNPTFNVDN
ncbi:MAG: caspase family protein, partial [Bacteroidota bacterium]